jgi:hypothetical protein
VSTHPIRLRKLGDHLPTLPSRWGRLVLLLRIVTLVIATAVGGSQRIQRSVVVPVERDSIFPIRLHESVQQAGREKTPARSDLIDEPR